MNIEVSLRDSTLDLGPDSLVAPVALLHAATLPFAAMDALRLPATEATLARITDAEAVIKGLRGPVAETLFDLVQGLETDTGLRRKVVNLRRDLHNGRGTKLAVDQCGKIAALITDPQARAQLDDWCHAGGAATRRHRGLCRNRRAGNAGRAAPRLARTAGCAAF